MEVLPFLLFFSHSRCDFFFGEEVVRDNKLFLSSAYLPVFMKYVAFQSSVPPSQLTEGVQNHRGAHSAIASASFIETRLQKLQISR